MDALVVAELTLRGEGGGGGTKMQQELAVKKESIFARARQAGIEIERIVNGVCYGTDQSPRLLLPSGSWRDLLPLERRARTASHPPLQSHLLA